MYKISLSAFSERLISVINMGADFSFFFESKHQQDSRVRQN